MIQLSSDQATLPLAFREGHRVEQPQSEIEVSVVEDFDRGVADLIDRIAADLPFGEAYSDWLWAVLQSRPPGLRMVFLIVRRGGRELGVAIAYGSSIDLASYAGPWLARAMRALRRFGLNSFRPRIAFLAAPFSNGPGVLLPPETSDEDVAAIYGKVSATLLERYRLSILMSRSKPCERVRSALRSIGFLERRLEFPDAVLDLGYRTFDEYVAQRDKKMRYKIRSETKIFTRAGGSVEVVADPAPLLPDVWALFHNTLCRHAERGEGIPPVEITEDFFKRCLLDKPERFRLLAARIGDRLVGFFLLIHAGKCLFVRHSGQDYDLSHETKAYFNLWYGTIRYAIESGYERLFMGTTTYFVKTQLGARLYPVDNQFYVRFELLRRLVGVLQRLRRNEVELPSLSRPKRHRSDPA